MLEARHVGSAELRIGDRVCHLPILEGNGGERVLDIRRLRADCGMTTLDYGYANTASCKSDITYLNGEEGVLLYRGYPIEELAEKSRFVEVAYLLVHGSLPTRKEHDRFSDLLNRHSLLHEDMTHFFYRYPEHAHPMAILSAMVVSLSTFYPELSGNDVDEELDITTTRLLSKMRTIAAFSYKKTAGEPFVYPRHDLSYCANFLNMMFSSPVSPYEIKPELVKALNVLLILHADHEQNCSTSAVRLVGSARVNLYAAVSSGICALWGPLHGGANQMVIEMLEGIARDGGDVKKCIERAKDRRDPFRLYGFGHRVYKTYDPRARIIKNTCHEVLQVLNKKDPLLDIARELEARALEDDFFIERRLYPNVDFYSGIIYRAMGFPTEMFTVFFALGRLPGWIAHWKESLEDPEFRIQRPRQVYTGPNLRHYVPLDKRS
ncbi:MAG: citrate synthase [Kiritimatiellaeota bacterium]|nr:citrate synthase [Kiritimatiellota bacterium]